MGCCNETPSRMGSIRGRRRLMAGKCGGRSESRCVTPCLLNSIICVSSHESVEQLPKERPMQDCAGLTSDCRIARALHQIKFELEASNGADATPSRRGLGERHIAVEVDNEEIVRSRTGGPRWWPPRRPRGCWRARRSPRGRSRPRRRRGGRARSGGLRRARSGRSRL